MTYYTAFQKTNEGTRVVREGYNRKEIFKAAQNRANQTGQVITVRSMRGFKIEFHEVSPERI